jgi:hypothetical protein
VPNEEQQTIDLIIQCVQQQLHNSKFWFDEGSPLIVQPPQEDTPKRVIKAEQTYLDATLGLKQDQMGQKIASS